MMSEPQNETSSTLAAEYHAHCSDSEMRSGDMHNGDQRQNAHRRNAKRRNTQLETRNSETRHVERRHDEKHKATHEPPSSAPRLRNAAMQTWMTKAFRRRRSRTPQCQCRALLDRR
eukprot:TRINITY_DN671_c0_g1_i1.p3 TRINITY_DN671_c0_g1~~TRINITY_DN671_c0_g1_i1.p3  ORF type:complete len:116 (-),score=1.67 TRINITY_DN671_c0_g1_i1:282-629(-)